MSEAQMPTSLQFATCIKAWWEKHKYDTRDGDYNVYDTEPKFVTMAKEILGDWEAPFVVDVYRSKSDYRDKKPDAVVRRFWSVDDAQTAAQESQFDDAYAVVVRYYSFPLDTNPMVRYSRFPTNDVASEARNTDNEGWFDVVAYSSKARWDGPCLGDGGLDGFASLKDAKAYADSAEFENFYQVAVIAYGEHDDYESGETAYSRFEREDA